MRIIAGALKNRKIKVPKGLDVRPTTNQMREAVFNICQSWIEGSRFLDLFSGSGAMGLEALSRGAESVTFIEINKNSLRCIQDNIETLSVGDKTCVLFGDVMKRVKSLSGKFDIIYADPPYEKEEYYLELLTYFDEGILVAENGVVMMESEFDLPKEGFKNLRLKDVRRFGKALLYQFINHQIDH